MVAIRRGNRRRGRGEDLRERSSERLELRARNLRQPIVVSVAHAQERLVAEALAADLLEQGVVESPLPTNSR